MKATSVRLSEYDLQRLDDLKNYWAECWGITKQEISTTDAISWSIGIAHLVKVQYDLSLEYFPDKTIWLNTPEYITKILTNEIIEFAKQCKYEQIELVVVNSNERAIKLYEFFGFKKFGTFVNSFKYPDGTYDDGIYMIKFLKD